MKCNIPSFLGVKIEESHFQRKPFSNTLWTLCIQLSVFLCCFKKRVAWMLSKTERVNVMEPKGGLIVLLRVWGTFGPGIQMRPSNDLENFLLFHCLLELPKSRLGELEIWKALLQDKQNFWEALSRKINGRVLRGKINLENFLCLARSLTHLCPPVHISPVHICTGTLSIQNHWMDQAIPWSQCCTIISWLNEGKFLPRCYTCSTVQIPCNSHRKRKKAQ